VQDIVMGFFAWILVIYVSGWVLYHLVRMVWNHEQTQEDICHWISGDKGDDEWDDMDHHYHGS
jgi:hypothetical protein